MKKALALGLSLCMAASLFGCGSSAEETTAAVEETAAEESTAGEQDTAEAEETEVSLDDYVYDGERRAFREEALIDQEGVNYWGQS